MQFTEQEESILRIVQSNLPDTLTPYADIAREAGVTEGEVLELLSRLKEDGTIRRFGASIRHQRTGWKHNAMVAWKMTEEEADLAGPLAARNARISHCYYRPSPARDWPYTFYTMIHGRSAEECLETVAELGKTPPFAEYAVLESIKELKKTSMTYFPASPARCPRSQPADGATVD